MDEELTELTSGIKPSASVVECANNESETKRLKKENEENTNKSSTDASFRVPVSLESMKSKSSELVIGLKEKEQESCAKCLDSKCCSVIWGILGVFFIGVTFMTPIASIIAGWKLYEVFDTYDATTINEQCEGEYDMMVYNGDDVGSHAFAVFIFGIVDFVLLLSQCVCIYGYIYRDLMDMDRNVFGVLAGVRLFFIVVWLVYASYMFKATAVLEEKCDQSGTFYNAMMDILIWYIPIMSIEVFKTFILIIAVIALCCILCCLA